MPRVGSQGFLLPDDRLAELVAGRGEPLSIEVERRDVVERAAQVAGVVGRIGILPRQPLADGPRPLVGRQGLRRPAGLAEQHPQAEA